MTRTEMEMEKAMKNYYEQNSKGRPQICRNTRTKTQWMRKWPR